MNSVNTLRPRQNGRHFPDDILKCIFLNENLWISIQISLTFVPKGPINHNPALVQIMAWRRSGDKPFSDPMMVKFTDAYMRHSASISTVLYGTILWHVWKCFGVLWVNSCQLVLISRSHARVSMHCYPIGCVIKSTHRGICSCSPIVNFLNFTFYHGMVTSVIFLIEK